MRKRTMMVWWVLFKPAIVQQRLSLISGSLSAHISNLCKLIWSVLMLESGLIKFIWLGKWIVSSHANTLCKEAFSINLLNNQDWLNANYFVLLLKGLNLSWIKSQSSLTFGWKKLRLEKSCLLAGSRHRWRHWSTFSVDFSRLNWKKCCIRTISFECKT